MGNFDELPPTGHVEVEPQEVEVTQRLPRLIIISGADEGRSFSLTQGTYVIGRARECEVHLFEEGVSRHHARVVVTGDEIRLLDDGSTNGTFVNGALAKNVVLRENDRVQLGQRCEIKLVYQDEVERAFSQRQYDFAKRDALTGCYNKRHLLEQMAMEFSYAQRAKSRLALVILDLDHFKALNDTHGHPAGDVVLAEAAERLRGVLRKHDLLARFGGEEFVALLRDADRVHAMVAAERLRASLEAAPFEVDGKSLAVTASLGVASYPETAADSAQALLAKADEALYRAKQAGRNCCRT